MAKKLKPLWVVETDAMTLFPQVDHFANSWKTPKGYGVESYGSSSRVTDRPGRFFFTDHVSMELWVKQHMERKLERILSMLGQVKTALAENTCHRVNSRSIPLDRATPGDDVAVSLE